MKLRLPLPSPEPAPQSMVNRVLLRVGGETPSPKPLNFDDIKRWNAFVDSNKEHGGLSREQLYSRYVQATGDKSIPLDSLNRELGMLESSAKNNANTHNLMTKDVTTIGNRFPNMVYNGHDYGPMNGQGKTEIPVTDRQSFYERNALQQLPAGVDKLDYDSEVNLPYFVDPHTGDMQYVARKFLGHPAFQKTQNK